MSALDDDRNRSVRRWATVGFAGQVLFVVSWLVAGLWQGSRYSALAHTISDMYAVTAPHGWFLVLTITLAGVSTVLFALLGLGPALQPGGWRTGVGVTLLALSILGLGDVLTPLEREACRIADPGCTGPDQTANLGGTLDGLLSTFGLLFLIACGFFLAAAMAKTAGWSALVWPTRIASIVVAVLFGLAGFSAAMGLGGLFERALAVAAAAGVGALALAVRRRA